MSLARLQTWLQSVPPGPIADVTQLTSLLAACWDEFDGGTAEKMEPWKLHDRLEKPTWNPPELGFQMERHGGTVLGSSRAEIHEWVVDLDLKTASCSKGKSRNVRPPNKPLDTEALVQEIIAVVREGVSDPRVEWISSEVVKVDTLLAVPKDGKVHPKTLTARRKRFRMALRQAMTILGWGEKSRDVFERSIPDRH
ncbi:MAG: hypothetical protein SFU86_18545 [Pirellulaceae bacterium]|nr:hypothetical protein [Pirellulaceae bacterium]